MSSAGMTWSDISAAKRTSQTCIGCALMAGLFAFYVVTLGHVLAQVTLVDGLTIQINQPAAMAASLYMAPQTYDRGKDRRNPYILVPKLKPACDWSSQPGFGRGPHGQHHHNHNRHKIGRPVNSVSRPLATVSQSPAAHTDNQLINPTTTSRRPLSNAANGEQLNDFAGSWKIKKPQTANNNKDWPTNQLVTYNEDGTRVLPESLYNLPSVRPFPTRNPVEYFHNVTSDDAIGGGGGGGGDKPQLIAANQSTSVEQLKLVGASTTTSTTSQLATVSQVRAEDSTISTAVSTTSTTPVARLRDEFYAVTVATVSSASFDASSTRRSSTIIDKLGGGAKRILAQIIGGILHGRQSQKNLELVKGKLDTLEDQQTADSAGLLAPISYHSGQLDGTITSPEDHVRSSGDHPLRATATDAPWPIDENLHANGSHRSSTNGGWRPVIPWPPAWLKAEQQQQKNGTVNGDGGSRPAAPPATLVHFWSSSSIWSHVGITEPQKSIPKWPPSLGGEFKASREPYSRTTTLTPTCLTTSLSSDPAEADLDPDPGQDTEIEAYLNGTETPSSNMDFINSSVDFKNGYNDVRNSDILDSNGTLNITEMQAEAEVDTIIGEEVVDVANMSNDQSDGSPRMSNSSWEEAFHPSVQVENAAGGRRRSCIGVGDTIRALVKVFQKLPLGIPKPLDILVSYGRHHLIAKSSTAVRSV